MKQRPYKSYISAGITGFCVLTLAIAFYFLLAHFSAVIAFFDILAHVLRPIFIGIIMAFLLLPIHRWAFRGLVTLLPGRSMERKNIVALLNTLSILISFCVAGILVYLLLAMLLPQLYTSIVGIVQAFPGYVEALQNWLQDFLDNNPEILEVVMPIYNSAALSLEQWLNSEILPNLESVTSTLAWLKESIIPNLTGVVSSVSAILISFTLLMKDLLIALIAAFYLLARKDVFSAQAKKILYSALPTGIADQLVLEARNAYRILNGFVTGKLLDSLIIGIIALVCCNLFDFPYPALLATVIGVTNVIPFFGPFIGAIPCAILIFLISPLKCIYFVIFILVLQQFDGNILGPKILGDSTGLASFWVLFSIILFGGLFGFAGMVLGVPVFAMFYSVANRLVRKGLQKRGLPVETCNYMGKTEPFTSYVRERGQASSHGK